ncbi:DAK2 domain-containing protein [Halalkalibacter hemicellulosilyticus]|uniref:Dihydroxyacetone kinase family protein n=1 Tax=Halalkalibacter hemicellulosilyticusJCM 9152 TaxID=1236971 RepID=W4QB58_9BACI|nr:DAK2 domain-containing protein [Halalkalibacter hemicellulosilyticus]GAE29202.1 dihydroxyacetone kinase family protein [Halalkalibacter hemicellulosilyticusJCM 9152]
MAMKRIEGNKLAHMFIEGAANLTNHVKVVDALNVFPVPDGDTGTNMNLSITSGVKEVKQQIHGNASQVASAFAKGLLMGARGNSGVILSQLFRGFSKELEGKQTVTSEDFALALQHGVETAYKAVMKPVEGTILTVAKDAAKVAKKASQKDENLVHVMEATLEEANRSLKRTPDLLPVLKEVGVVDSGGQGLVYIYEGFLAVLKGEKLATTNQEAPSMDDLVKVEHHNAQSHLATEDIEFGFCTEVMVQFADDKLATHPFNEPDFRQELSELGDSLLVVSDEDLLKVHIHAEHPGEVLNKAQRFGELVNIKIENMRMQHTNLLEESKQHHEQERKLSQSQNQSEYGIVTVSMGEGIAKLFKGLGASVVIPGGQTMNPSTEDIIKAIKEANAKKVIILPNNGNIIMAAEQAAEVAGEDVSVVPSKTVPQGLAALLAFNPSQSLENNQDTMKAALTSVTSGQVTYAVRDTTIDGVEIKKDDYMGIADKKIVSSGQSLLEVTKDLLDDMIDEESEIVTLLQGEDATDEGTKEIVHYIEEKYEDVEVDVHQGDQPLYSYLLSVE